MKGLSLLEVLITLGIGIIVGVVLVTIMINSMGLFYKQSSKVAEGLNINDALSEIRKDIKISNSVVDTAVIDGGTYTSSSSQMVLKIPAVDSANNILTDVFDYFVFFQDNNKLRFKSFPDPASSRKAQDRIFSTSVDGLLIEYLDSASPPAQVVPQTAAKVRISLKLKQKSGSDFEIVVATSEASLRNN